MMASRALRVALFLMVGGVLSLTVGAPTGEAAGDSSSSQTLHGEGRFSDLAVTVSQTKNIRNQVVKVTWSGAQLSQINGGKFAANYLQIMQCWGDEAAPKHENCQYGGNFFDTRGGSSTATRQVSYSFVDPDETYHKEAGSNKPALVPFEAVNGKSSNEFRNEFFDASSTNEIPYGRTSRDGTGQEFFEVQTAREAPGLGCGARLESGPRNCWLVVVPRDDREADGTPTSDLPEPILNSSPLSASNFAHAISFRLDFEPIGLACPIGSAERRVLGNEGASEAVMRWQPVLCEEANTIFGFSQIGDDTARAQVLADTPWLSIVGDPVSPDAISDGREVTYAPVAIHAVGIAVNIERVPKETAPDGVKNQRGTRVLGLKLSARLVAKLLTQSYGGSVPGLAPYLDSNPRSLNDDPEFLKLNPEFDHLQFPGKLYAITNPLGLSDANRAVWKWIASDSDAVGFIAGKKDPWGARINPNYKAMNLDVASFPRSDPTCSTFPFSETKQQPLCSLDWLAYASDFHAAARAAARGSTLANGNWDISANPPRYKNDEAQPSGERAVLALVDTATAARFALPLARLENASGDFVAPDDLSMSKSLRGMKNVSGTGLKQVDPAAKVAGAYPLTQVDYAVTAPHQLTDDEANDYANFLRYAAGDGQTRGLAAGNLPDGYLPLPTVMREQAEEAADLIAKGGSPIPSESTAPTSTPSPPPGSGSDPGALPGEAPSDGTVPSAGPSPSVTTDASAVPVSFTTPATTAGPMRFLLLGALLLGLLAAVGRPLAPYLARLQRRRRGPQG